MASSEKRRMAPDQRRRQIAEAALLEFAARPYNEVSIADVARAAGISKALVLRYFESKPALYLETMEMVVGIVREATDPDPALPATDRFRIALEAYIDLMEQYPHGLPSFEQGEISRDPRVAELTERAFEEVADRIVERMGVTDPPPALRHAARSWFAYVRTSALEWLNNPEGATRDQLIAMQLATFRAAAAEALGIELGPREGDWPEFLP